MKSDGVAFAIADRLFASTVLLVFAILSQPVLSGQSRQPMANSGTIDHSSPTTPKGNGVIVGIVVNERHEPVACARVQAFSANAARNTPGQESVLPPGRGDGSTTTDAEGHFVISGLPLGDYLIAAESLLGGGGRGPAGRYGATFYPSTLDVQDAVSVSAFSNPATPVEIRLVPVRGA